MVPYYEVSEIRTRADSIVQKTGLTKNAEDLLTVSKADEPDQVTDVQTLLHRVHALFMAMEYLNICTYSRAAGPLKYLQELEQFKADCPGLPYLPQKGPPPPVRAAGDLHHVRGRFGRGAQQPQIPVE